MNSPGFPTAALNTNGGLFLSSSVEANRYALPSMADLVVFYTTNNLKL